jgi:cytochrome P450
VLTGIMRETEAKLGRGEASRSSDLIACLLSLTDDGSGGSRGTRLVSDQEILDNVIITLVAGHDTSAVLLTFMVRYLADHPDTLAAMVQGKQQL